MQRQVQREPEIRVTADQMCSVQQLEWTNNSGNCSVAEHFQHPVKWLFIIDNRKRKSVKEREREKEMKIKNKMTKKESIEEHGKLGQSKTFRFVLQENQNSRRPRIMFIVRKCYDLGTVIIDNSITPFPVAISNVTAEYQITPSEAPILLQLISNHTKQLIIS